MPSEYQQDYKKTHAYAPKIYNDPNMSDELRDIYRTLESRYVHEGRTIDPSFCKDLSDDSVAKFIAIGTDIAKISRKRSKPGKSIARDTGTNLKCAKAGEWLINDKTPIKYRKRALLLKVPKNPKHY
ncbi:hypothetical protein Tco_0408658 [Tanacetum coccineum]